MPMSIVICTHNRCDMLRETLDSLARLSTPGLSDWEVVVVDNASEDGTRAMVDTSAAVATFPIRYVHEARLGHSCALNTGVRGSTGDIIAFTDDDAIPAADWLSRIQSTFEEFGADIVFGRVTPLWEAGAPDWFSERFAGKFALLDYGPEPFVVKDLRHPFYGVNHAVRRAVMEALGGYREDRGARGEAGGSGNDFDLFERALKAGMTIVYDPRIVVEHRIPSSRCTKGYQRNLISRSSRPYFSYVMETEGALPRLAGIPRYRFRVAAELLARYLKSVVTRRTKDAFYLELELRKFAVLLAESRTKGS